MRTFNKDQDDPVCTLPRDEHGHIIGAETDPYGHLTYTVGNADDFICLDYAFVTDKKGFSWAIIHSVVNSETGSFIQDFDYSVVPFNVLNPANVIQEARDAVFSALDWCIENQIRTNRREAFHFVRDVACACVTEGNLAGYEDLINRFSSRQRRFGGKRINQFVNGLADAKVF